MLKRLTLAAAALASVLWAGGAQAGGDQGACTTAGYTTTYASQCASDANKAGTEVTSAAALRAATTQSVGLISNRIAALTTGTAGSSGGPLGKGISGGSKEMGLGVWLNAGYTTIDYDKAGSQFDGDVWTGMGGVDYKFNDKLTAGLAVGYESLDLDTTFNRGTLSGDGWTVAPYAVYMLSKTYFVDMIAGYTNVDYDMTRKDPLTNAGITGKTDANRYFGAANVNGQWMQDAWRFGAKVGALYSREKKDAFTESNNTVTAERTTNIGQANAGGSVGYSLGVIEPYTKAAYRYDFQDGGAADKDDVLVGLGSKFYIGGATVGQLEVSTPLGRDDTTQWDFTATVRMNF